MTMKALLTATAVIEAAAGLALAICPSLSIRLLLGTSPDSPTLSVIARVTGAALLSLGVACWFARHDAQGRAASGLIAAMLLYNISTVCILACACLVEGLHGIGLWPGVALHTALTCWCAACLRSRWMNQLSS